MRLLGAKEFLKTVNSGTVCIEFWMNNAEECLDVIRDYEESHDAKSLFEKYHGEVFVYGDNVGSLMFIEESEFPPVSVGGIDYRCFSYTDLNIVGDASPWTTLYLAFDDEAEWLDETPIADSVETLSKDDMKRAIKWFLNTHGPFDGRLPQWALDVLEEDDPIINYKTK